MFPLWHDRLVDHATLAVRKAFSATLLQKTSRIVFLYHMFVDLWLQLLRG